MERMAVSAIEDAVSKTNCLVSHINSGDKYPSLDGCILVYSPSDNNNYAKEYLKGTVDVQVKGITEKKNRMEHVFPISVIDMQNYLKECGVMFFAVYYDQKLDEKHIYYKKLLPYDLRKILENSKGEKTKNIKLNLFPNDKHEIVDLFLNFLADKEKQRTAISGKLISLDEIRKENILGPLSFGYTTVGEKEFPWEYLFNHDVYIYEDIGRELKMPISHIENINAINAKQEKNIYVGNSCYYKRIEVKFEKDDLATITIGKSVTLICSSNRMKLHFSLKGNLEERILASNFIIAALTTGKIEIDSFVQNISATMPGAKSSLDIDKIKDNLNYLYKIREILKMLDVQDNLKMDEMDRQDFLAVDMLIKSVMDNNFVSLKNIEMPFGIVNIANLKILVCAHKERNSEKYKISNFLSARLDAQNDNIKCKIPSFVILKKKLIIECNNIAWDRIFEQMNQTEHNSIFGDKLNDFLLEVIKAADESGNPKFLKRALRIANFLENPDLEFSSEGLVLNSLQILKRYRQLTNNEISELENILAKPNLMPDVATGAYLLLGNHQEAKKCFLRMDKEAQNSFCEYPIFYFWKK